MPIFDLDHKGVMEDSDSTMSAEEDSGKLSGQVEKLKKSHVVTSEHIHGQGWRWREPFDVNLIPRFNTYIYAFTWEDPLVDLQFLDLKKEDHMMVISSGGCNVLEYAIQVGPARYNFMYNF
jgi:betaine lipid synthase